jgi:hypothetical protein
MKRLSILFFLMASLIQNSFSQSEFIARDQSGFGGGWGISANSEANGLMVFAGYSYRGFLDANLTYSKANGGRVQGGVLSPSITFYPIKQEDAENAPTIGVSLGFSRYTSKTTTKVEEPNTVGIGWHWYEKTEEVTINALKLGVTAQRRLGYYKALFFQPMLGGVLVMTNSGWEFALRGGVAIGTRVVRGPLLILTPGIEYQSGLTTFVITFGAVF